MEFYKMYLTCVLIILLGFFNSTQAYKFFVGGKDGWVVNPHENYNHWAERNRFRVKDTLYFKYKNGSDSILVVTKEAYNACNTTNPIREMKDGESEFKIERSGPFYFISGNCGNCQKGQKLVVVVLAVRPKKSPPTPAPAVSPSPSDIYPPPSDNQAPAPSPSKSAAPKVLGRPMVMIWGLSIVASVMLQGSTIGLI